MTIRNLLGTSEPFDSRALRVRALAGSTSDFQAKLDETLASGRVGHAPEDAWEDLGQLVRGAEAMAQRGHVLRTLGAVTPDDVVDELQGSLQEAWVALGALRDRLGLER